MKKLCLTSLMALGIVAACLAQDPSKIMVTLGGGILAPGCTNCSSLSGFTLGGGYAITNHIVGSLGLGFYSKTDGSAKLNSTAIGVSGDYYLKEAYKGFFVGPDITYLTISDKVNGTEVFSQNNITIGLNVGWGIVLIENWRIIPHLGYGTWYDNSKGRFTAGLQVGYVLP